jgi:hypothetical protein
VSPGSDTSTGRTLHLRMDTYSSPHQKPAKWIPLSHFRECSTICVHLNHHLPTRLIVIMTPSMRFRLGSSLQRRKIEGCVAILYPSNIYHQLTLKSDGWGRIPRVLLPSQHIPAYTARHDYHNSITNLGKRLDVYQCVESHDDWNHCTCSSMDGPFFLLAGCENATKSERNSSRRHCPTYLTSTTTQSTDLRKHELLGSNTHMPCSPYFKTSQDPEA